MKGQTSTFKSGWDNMWEPGWVYKPYSRYYEPCPPDYETPAKTPEEVAADSYRTTSITAEAALKHYNKKHCEKYELVDPVASGGHLYSDGVWFHCNFKARPKTSLEGHDFPSKLFFAELKAADSNKYLVTTCRPIDGTKTTVGCEICSSVRHPTRGFRKGRYVSKQRLLRPRKGGKVVK
ncbi:hypothetical protein RND81_03G169200 [Saponaria officinalis]